MHFVLGIDTSCYQTSCAAVDLKGQLLADSRRILKVPKQQRGLRQSEAVFQHLKQLPDVLQDVFDQIGEGNLAAVCASSQPVNRPDSYMPVFVTGSSYARSIAASHHVPIFFTSHQEGHFAAAQIGVRALPETHLAIHLSGGTTELIFVNPAGYRLLGGTLDISAGQLLDRIGVEMGYDFPAGPSLEALATAAAARSRYPAIVKGMNLSLSGVEAAARRDLAQAVLPKEEIAAELFDAIVRGLSKLMVAAAEQTKVYDVLLTGGVASSRLLRELLDERLRKRAGRTSTFYGLPQFAGDNAAGVALIGLKYLLKEKEHGHRIERKRTV